MRTKKGKQYKQIHRRLLRCGRRAEKLCDGETLVSEPTLPLEP